MAPRYHTADAFAPGCATGTCGKPPQSKPTEECDKTLRFVSIMPYKRCSISRRIFDGARFVTYIQSGSWCGPKLHPQPAS